MAIQKPKPVKRLFDFAEPKTGKTIMTLRHDSCRFIINDGETPIYCGKKKERGPYCAEHYKVCYVPVRKAMQAKIERIAGIKSIG